MELTLEDIDGEAVDLVVGDLSFIPLGLVLPALARCAASDADLVVMVKPQFEVGKERLGSGGVVREGQELRAETVREVARRAWGLGLGVRGVTASPLPGPSGNVRFRRCGPAHLSWIPRMSMVQWRRGPVDDECDDAAAERTVFLLAHTGRPAAIRSAELVVQGLLRNGLGVRVLGDRGGRSAAPGRGGDGHRHLARRRRRLRAADRPRR
ncbi:hypothetical protein SHIRM173S_12965 [Streptomyces hirsutus]